MPNLEKLALLKAMLGQVAPEPGRIESIPHPGSAEFVLEAAAPNVEHLASALEKLSTGREEELDENELFVTEAIILPDRRPVVLIEDGEYGTLRGEWSTLEAPAVRRRLTPLLSSIGRVELPNDPSIPYGGTGFVVGRNLLMTNRHVARLFAEGLGMAITYHPHNAAVDFKQEFGTKRSDSSARLEVVSVEMIHPYWDMALLRIEGLDGRFHPLPLSTGDPRELTDQDVVVVGYPARDDRNDMLVQDKVFEGIYHVKRLQPGKVRGRASIQSFENRVSALTHDSSTLGGNSGSAVIGVKSGRVVGLHFAGVYLKSNYAVPTYELARDRRVVRFGLNFDGEVPATDAWDPAWVSTGPGEAASVVPAPVAVTHRLSEAASWTIPIRVKISLGTPVSTGSGAPQAPAGVLATPTEAMRSPIVVGNLANRTGYRSDFLGLAKKAKVPLPLLTKKGRDAVAHLAGRDPEIKYHKFSIVLHKRRQLALYTAANVDWRPSVRLIKGRKPTRKELTGLGPNDIEKWVTDSRVKPEHQLPDEFYTKDGGAFDKGHLVRRDDVVWGESFKDMQKANGDTYHTTNCSPQVKSFNQSAQGEDNWGDLESLVQQETKSERAILFSGPVLDDDDRVFVGRGVGGSEIRLQIPRRFWKIVVVKQRSDAGAYGFVLEQDLSSVPLEFAVPESWRRYMAPIEEIESMLGGLVDMKWLKKRDRSGAHESVAIRRALE